MNILGRGFYNYNAGSIPDATNSSLTIAETPLYESPLFLRYFKLKKKSFILHPGQSRVLAVGSKRRSIRTYDIFVPGTNNTVFTDFNTWLYSMPVFAKGILFKAYAQIAAKGTSPDHSFQAPITHSVPEYAVECIFNYNATRNASVLQNSNTVYMTDYGNVTNATPTIILEDIDTAAPVTNV